MYNFIHLFTPISLFICIQGSQQQRNKVRIFFQLGSLVGVGVVFEFAMPVYFCSCVNNLVYALTVVYFHREGQFLGKIIEHVLCLICLLGWKT